MKTTIWPLGFSATGLSAGLSKKKNKKDMALFVSHFPAEGAAVFTNNQVKAAPLLVSQKHLLETRGKVRAMAVNTGSANAATGRIGIQNAETTVRWISESLKLPKNEIWVASTGVIGIPLNLKKYRPGLAQLVTRIKKGVKNEGDLAAEAIMTTDTKPKVAAVQFEIGGVPVHVWGCAKGAGMIHPDLRGPRGELHATMLSFILTDACIKSSIMQRALEWVADKTFNCVSVDGDTSTNDFVGVMANGASGAQEIHSTSDRYYKKFRSGLHEVCEKLTSAIAMDGEGASRMVQIFIENARSESSARQMASVIASSPLVKTACHGADPNWGRILAAMGRSGVKFDPSRVKIWLGPLLVCERGMEKPFSEAEAIQYLKKKSVIIRVDLGLGRQWSHYKTCDFTGQYVGINAGYRT